GRPGRHGVAGGGGAAPARGRRTGRGLGTAGPPVAVQEQRQRDGAEAGLRALEKLAAGLRPRLLDGQGAVSVQVHGNQPLVKTLSRFKRTLATAVQAANSAGSVPGGSGPSGTVARATAA